MPVAHDIAERLEIQFRREAQKHPNAVASVAYHCGNEIHTGMIGQERNSRAAAGTSASRFLAMCVAEASRPSLCFGWSKPVRSNWTARCRDG